MGVPIDGDPCFSGDDASVVTNVSVPESVRFWLSERLSSEESEVTGAPRDQMLAVTSASCIFVLVLDEPLAAPL